jgi:uncharacterized protein (TIGR02145 family)
LENGNALAGTNQATYDVPTNKAAGVYTYVRQSKSAECPDWQSSNEFTVTVFACSFTAGTATGSTATFTDPRDGKKYKTVVMPDGRTWFAQNLNYTKDLTFNMYAYEANGKQFTSLTSGANGSAAIGSYWCPGMEGATYSGDQNTCNIYGALYTWETAMMVDGKYADESRTSSAWDESWVSSYYYNTTTPSDLAPNADRNNARGSITAKNGGRGICPMGWHIPTAKELAYLLNKADGDGTSEVFYSITPNEYRGSDVGKKLKSAGTYSVNDPGDGTWLAYSSNVGTDEYQFSMLPTGQTDPAIPMYQHRGSSTMLRSSSLQSSSTQYTFTLTHVSATIMMFTAARRRAIPVRCIKDALLP